MTEPADPYDSSLDEVPEVDPNKIRLAIEELRSHQNLIGGTIAGFLASCVGAALWAVVTIATGMQIGWFAIGIGFLVGYALRTFGKGLEPVFGFIGGALSLLGCLVGNLLAMIGLIAGDNGLPFLEVLTAMDADKIVEHHGRNFQSD